MRLAESVQTGPFGVSEDTGRWTGRQPQRDACQPILDTGARPRFHETIPAKTPT